MASSETGTISEPASSTPSSEARSHSPLMGSTLSTSTIVARRLESLAFYYREHSITSQSELSYTKTWAEVPAWQKVDYWHTVSAFQSKSAL